jgi:hypothetical protein
LPEAAAEVKPIDRVRLCLAVMANLKEGDTIFNNCCQKAAGRVLAGETGTMMLEEIMREVQVDCDERNERNEKRDRF